MLVCAAGLARAHPPPSPSAHWGLIINWGDVYDPKDPTPLGTPAMSSFGGDFKTKEECEEAAGKAIRDAYADAGRHGMVAEPPGWQCFERVKRGGNK